MAEGLPTNSAHSIDVQSGAPGPEILRLVDLHKSLGTHEVLRGLSLSAARGDVISILGSSGSGKSTFLRCLNLLEIPARGAVTLDGESVFDGSGALESPGRQAVARHRVPLVEILMPPRRSETILNVRLTS